MSGLFKGRTNQKGNITFIKQDIRKYIPEESTSDKEFYHIYNFAEDTLNDKLYLMRNGYITVVDQLTGEVSTFQSDKANPAVARTQILVHNSIMWETCGGKLFLFDVQNKKIWEAKSKNIDQQSMFSFCNTVYRDKSGIIWIGTKGYGLLKYNPNTEQFHSTATTSIIWMSTTPKNDMIMQTQDLLLYKRIDSTKSYAIDSNLFLKAKQAVPLKHSDLAVQNKDGTYFVNISNIVKFNPATGNIKVIDKASVFPLFIANNGDLWFGDKSAFCNLDKNTDLVKEYPYPIDKISMFPYQFLEVIHQDNDGIFWLGTVNGLFRFNATTKEWKQYINTPNDRTSLSSDIIFTICADPKYPETLLWIGTNGGGLNCFNKKSGKFITISEKEGLPNQVVYGILNDDNDNLWISSNKGLSKYTPAYTNSNGIVGLSNKIGTFKNYEEEDGLQSNEFNRYAFARTSDGILFFGGINGFNYFNPKEINSSNTAPNIIITDFKLSNKSVLFATPSLTNQKNYLLLEKPIFLTEKIVLPYKDNVIGFEFAAMDFTSSEKNVFQYKLDNFDKEWIQSGISHTATYTNLDPGTYIFKVKGSSNNGGWNEKGASVILEILPPWYMQWWFKISLFLLVTGIIYSFYRYRLRQAIKILNVRNRIANDLHDEIGSTLSSVYIYSEVAQKITANKIPEASTYLKNISVDVAGMIEALNDIVWTVNARNDRFENIGNKMRASAVELFEARNYQLHFELDEQLNSLILGMDDRKNFYLLYKEAINNLAKYANGKNVWISIQYKKPFISLSIKDDGAGFNTNKKNAGNGLLNIKKRASDLKGELHIDSVIGKGTTVQLQFRYS